MRRPSTDSGTTVFDACFAGHCRSKQRCPFHHASQRLDGYPHSLPCGSSRVSARGGPKTLPRDSTSRWQRRCPFRSCKPHGTRRGRKRPGADCCAFSWPLIGERCFL